MHSPLYFEDFQVGQLYDSQSKTLTESEIIDFAWQYDPQPFHISTEGAKDTPFGGVIASGFQTLAVTFRLLWQANGLQATGIGAGGLDYVRWHKPVRRRHHPGHVESCRFAPRARSPGSAMSASRHGLSIRMMRR